MLVGSRQKLCALQVLLRPSINGTPIERITTAKSLGVLINDKFSCRSHHPRTKKIASGIGDLKLIRHLFLYGTLYSVYLAQAQAYFKYYTIAGGNCGVNMTVETAKTTKQSSPCSEFSYYMRLLSVISLNT